MFGCLNISTPPSASEEKLDFMSMKSREKRAKGHDLLTKAIFGVFFFKALFCNFIYLVKLGTYLFGHEFYIKMYLLLHN